MSAARGTPGDARRRRRKFAQHRFAQPVDDDVQTPLKRLMAPVAQEVRTGPDIMAAAKRYGRILPHPLITALPLGFDPYRPQPTQKLLGPGAMTDPKLSAWLTEFVCEQGGARGGCR